MSKQNTLMFVSPDDGSPKPYPSNADQWRKYHGKAAWLFNPWSGRMRKSPDVGSDPFGLLIVPEGESLCASDSIADNRAELLAEDIECLHMSLDKHGVPRGDSDGETYSLWGRVIAFKNLKEQA